MFASAARVRLQSDVAAERVSPPEGQGRQSAPSPTQFSFSNTAAAPRGARDGSPHSRRRRSRTREEEMPERLRTIASRLREFVGNRRRAPRRYVRLAVFVSLLDPTPGAPPAGV